MILEIHFIDTFFLFFYGHHSTYKDKNTDLFSKSISIYNIYSNALENIHFSLREIYIFLLIKLAIHAHFFFCQNWNK